MARNRQDTPKSPTELRDEDLDKVSGGACIGGVGQVFGAIADTASDTAATAAEVVGDAGEAVGDAATSAGEALGDAIDEAVEGATTAANQAGEAAQQTGQQIGDGLDAAAEQAGETASEFGKAAADVAKGTAGALHQGHDFMTDVRDQYRKDADRDSDAEIPEPPKPEGLNFVGHAADQGLYAPDAVMSVGGVVGDHSLSMVDAALEAATGSDGSSRSDGGSASDSKDGNKGSGSNDTSAKT